MNIRGRRDGNTVRAARLIVVYDWANLPCWNNRLLAPAIHLYISHVRAQGILRSYDRIKLTWNSWSLGFAHSYRSPAFLALHPAAPKRGTCLFLSRWLPEQSQTAGIPASATRPWGLVSLRSGNDMIGHIAPRWMHTSTGHGGPGFQVAAQHSWRRNAYQK